MAPRSLRLKLSLTLTGVVFGSLFFVTAGTYLYVAWGEYRFYNSLSPDAQRAYARTWTETGMPSKEILEEVAAAEETYLVPVYEGELAVVAWLSIVAIAITGVASLLLARRLTTPLEIAAGSARRIAGGDFEHRIEVPGRSSSEVASLVESFTEMAQSLQERENDVRFISASVAHEIRTPLTVVQGYLQGIRDGVFEADDERLDAMLQRMEALGRLLHDLQTVSLAESGRLQLESASIPLAARLRALVDWLQTEPDTSSAQASSAQASSAQVTFEGPDKADDRAIDVDAQRLEQVVLALVQNARRYGGESIVVRYEPLRSDGAHLVVEDDGPGFSDEALSHAQDRFWRGEASRSRDTGGSGLGLAVARAIVEAHGGTLELSNLETGGARVSMRLPG